ncbi:MAG: hypothetical protein WDO70_09360 [Alphaproteobacteria bacterium]
MGDRPGFGHKAGLPVMLDSLAHPQARGAGMIIRNAGHGAFIDRALPGGKSIPYCRHNFSGIIGLLKN